MRIKIDEPLFGPALGQTILDLGDITEDAWGELLTAHLNTVEGPIVILTGHDSEEFLDND